MSQKRAEILTKSPKTLEDVKIEGAWRKTKQRKEFVLHQEIGFVIFATTEGLEFLVRSKNIMVDGNFKLPPPPPQFTQIYALFGTNGEWIVPVVWAFLGSTTEKIYSKFFFTILSEKSFENFSVYLMPESIITDRKRGNGSYQENFCSIYSLGMLVPLFPMYISKISRFWSSKRLSRQKPEKNCATTFQFSAFA